MNGTSPNVLLIETEPNLLKLMEIGFRSLGYGVFPCMDLDQMRQITRKVKPDLIFIDQLALIDEKRFLLRDIKQQLPELQIVVTSNYSSLKTGLGEVLDTEFFFLQKPFDFTELQAFLEKKVHRSVT